MTDKPEPETCADDIFLRDVRTAIAVLEQIADNGSLIEKLPSEERMRLHQGVGNVYLPDPTARRQSRKAALKQKLRTKLRNDDGVLHATGIRALRRAPVITTPSISVAPMPNM